MASTEQAKLQMKVRYSKKPVFRMAETFSVSPPAADLEPVEAETGVTVREKNSLNTQPVKTGKNGGQRHLD